NLAVMIPSVFNGSKIVFMPPGRLDPDVAARIIEQEGVTRFGGVPTVVARILDSGVHEKYDFSTVTGIGYGGAPASPRLLARIVEAFPSVGDRVVQGYGLTETSAITTVNVGPDYLARPNSAGIAAPSVEIRIAGPDGEALPPGRVGEIWVRGANVIPRYWNRPEADAAGFTDGFLHTGDLGYLDADGFLYVTDRAKDMVIRGGENVYCVEVEAVLEEHPAVREVAVVGVPHPELGEEVKAVAVIAAEADISAEELLAFAARRLAPFKVPTQWELTTEMLPRNPSGKVLKAALREGGSVAHAVGEETDSAL
ncbi:MAG: class I adenylate-forming enzyme family protein, partial [Acidimicrobiia bacterium]